LTTVDFRPSPGKVELLALPESCLLGHKQNVVAYLWFLLKAVGGE